MQVYREVMRGGNGRGRVLWDGNFRCRKWACVTGSLQAFPPFGGVSEPDACGSADGSARLGTEGVRAAGMIRRALGASTHAAPDAGGVGPGAILMRPMARRG